MLKYNIKIAFRNIIRNKLFSFINILGLSVGMACTILIFLWIQDELSFDKFHKNNPNLYRVISEQNSSGVITHTAITQYPLANAIKNDFPEVLGSTRVFVDNYPKDLKINNKIITETNFIYADSTFFNLFSFPLISGNPEFALSNPYSIIISENIANKYFNNENPVGKIIEMDFFNELKPFKITGIIKNEQFNSHLQFDFLIPFHIFSPLYSDLKEWKTADNYYTYVLINKKSSKSDLNSKLENYLQNYIPESKNKLILQPVNKIHLYSNLKFDSINNGNIKYVYFFSIIATFILLIACINFINLSTAKSEKRSKEVGLRKVVGAKKIHLVKQFFFESVIFTICALFFSII